MLGVESIPALVYFITLFFVPESPRWLVTKGLNRESEETLEKIYGNEIAKKELKEIEKSIDEKSVDKKVPLSVLLKPSLRFVMIVGLTLGIVQQITGINAIYFYATSIFKQTGIGTDAAFLSGVFLSLTTVLFTIMMFYILFDNLVF